METILKGIPGTAVYLDDILMTGTTVQEHLERLDIVFQRLHEAGLRLNLHKCSFLKEKVEYLGHILDATGLHASPSKVQAIKQAPAPKNVPELRAFFSLVNYSNRFLPDLSSKLAPLYQLLQKRSRWKWEGTEQSSFQSAKDALQQNSVIAHYDSSKPLILSCDASYYRLGAVLSHTMDEGSERPILFASRTLNPIEHRYSQVEKEALAIVFGVKKFHNFLYGRSFVIESDHQPLSFIFKKNKGIPQMASSRVSALGSDSFSLQLCNSL